MLEEARQALGLPGLSSEAQVRQAYRRLAAEEQHRLALGEARGATDRSAALRQASELLLRYCRARKGSQETPGEGASSEDRRDLFLITVNRAANDDVEPARYGAGSAGWGP
jgi:hypothetical protein